MQEWQAAEQEYLYASKELDPPVRGGSTCKNKQHQQNYLGVGQHARMVGQHEQEWWVNMVRNL